MGNNVTERFKIQDFSIFFLIYFHHFMIQQKMLFEVFSNVVQNSSARTKMFPASISLRQAPFRTTTMTEETPRMYQDFANADAMELGTKDDKNKKSCSVEHKFLVKLHYMLEDMEKDGLDLVISWQPHGRCFVIHDPKRLELVLSLRVLYVFFSTLSHDTHCL